MLNPGSPLAALLDAPLRPGVVIWIGLRPARRAPVVSVTTATLDPVRGLLGDHHSNSANNRRQVTLIQSEHLVSIAGYLGVGDVAPGLLRRNIVVSEINLVALKERHVRIGSVVLAVTGECHPCSRMEEVLGIGGYNAVRGHGGMTARVVSGGVIRVGDALARVHAP
jgi:MOSC domain-containing protein YiiM